MHTSSTVSISNINPVLPRIILTTGEPAGIGPDLLIDIAAQSFPAQLVCLTDPALLTDRAKQLNQPLQLVEYDGSQPPAPHQPGKLLYLSVATAGPVTAGQPDIHNVPFVLDSIARATRACLNNEFDAMVTAPVNKGVINDSGRPFTGHTEFIAELCNVELPVMMLMNRHLRVALVTTHLPLAMVPAAITRQRLEQTLRIVNQDLRTKFGIAEPVIRVCGLNPHAGETGHMGSEEITVITPVINDLQAQGMRINGPLPADTAFTVDSRSGADVVVAMYHDQGLPVLKSLGFGETVNVTLGLPIIRTSVDHGTALELAGSGRAGSGSLQAAISIAIDMAGAANQTARSR